MTLYTPYEREMMAQAKRTNQLLESLVTLMAPTKILSGMASAPDGPPKSPGEVADEIARAAGLTPVAAAGPPTPEQRAARWADRAKEVGMAPEKAQEAADRAAAAMTGVVERPTAKKTTRAKRT